MDPVAIFESHNPRCPGRSFRFRGLVGEVCAPTVKEVLPSLAAVESAVCGGLHAAGFITYEAASGIDPLLATQHERIARSEGPTRTLPLVWFGLYQEREEINPSIECNSCSPAPLQWSPSLTKEEYLHSIERIQEYIRAGDTYQVNFTYRLHAELTRDPWLLYRSLCLTQGASYCAYIDIGSHLILSASPELFFRWKDGLITVCPMKGTSRRGRDWLEDERLKNQLAESAKNRAENVMIVDLMRNDLGRLAEVGSVTVDHLFEIERYRTVLQMTSTVSARVRPEVTFVGLLSSLFPSGSVTGAPKIRTMQIIRDLERTPRGIYTGAIGFLSPGQEAVFSVAIRTVVAESGTGKMEFGLGGGITHHSVPLEEYQESFDKAHFLSIKPQEFALLESLLYESGQGYFLLDRHLRRLERSAAFFAYPFRLQLLTAALDSSTRGLGPGRYKVRLLLNRIGEIRVECSPLSAEECPAAEPAVIHLEEPVDCEDVFLFNKTTHREVYEMRRMRYPLDWHVILVNRGGEVTESTTANVVVRTQGHLYTPPAEAGLLPGTYREELLECGLLEEKTLRPEDLLHAETVYLINSVRGWIRIEPRMAMGAED